MTFKIGQRVRAIAVLHPKAERYIGAIGTIVSESYQRELPPTHEMYTCQNVRWEEGVGAFEGMVGHEPVKCLAPLDDPGEFESFMNSVLKPLPEEVLA